MGHIRIYIESVNIRLLDDMGHIRIYIESVNIRLLDA